MCGIAGIASRERLTETDRAFVGRASHALAHRGPDGDGMWSDDHVVLGHRRLAIIDVGGGAQPMSDVTGRYTITFNGEIYNYREQRDALESLGYHFKTASDTEVILNAYAQWGAASTERLNGIFAFGLWDSHERVLFLARDHLGVKPLLYWQRGSRIIFASTLMALLHHPAVSTEIDPHALSDYLSLGYVLTPKTIIKGINKLPPASSLRFDMRGCHERRYWNLAAVCSEPPAPAKSLAVAADELREELKRTVRLQLVSDVPVGAFLSGGLDSSTIVQKMAELSASPVKTFSLGFAQGSYSELPYARTVAERFGSCHTEDTVDADLGVLLPQLAWYFDEPFADTSAVPTYLLCQMARRQITVALSGDGGDECFAGYDTYVADWLQRRYRRLPAGVHRFLSGAAGFLPATHRKVSWDYKLKQFLSYAQRTPEEAHYSWRLLFSESEKRAILGDDWCRAVGDYTPLETFLDYYREVPAATPLNQALYVDSRTWLADAMLVKVDRASMATGLEVRVPLLDPRLVEFSMRLPTEQKLDGFKTKVILKAAMERDLPRSIVHRKKRGFNAPAAYWVKTMSRPQPPATTATPGLTQEWSRLMTEHRAHRADHGFKLWALLTWSLWESTLVGNAEHAFDRRSAAQAT